MYKDPPWMVKEVMDDVASLIVWMGSQVLALISQNMILASKPADFGVSHIFVRLASRVKGERRTYH